jgi:hypothetical protein
VKKPAIKVNYVLLCDDARREDNGKAIVIGLYNEAMVVPKETPQVVTPLAFFIQATMPKNKPIHVVTWLEGPGGDRLSEADWGDVCISADAESIYAQIVWKLNPWRSVGFGKYRLHLTQANLDSVIHEFEVRAN